MIENWAKLKTKQKSTTGRISQYKKQIMMREAMAGSPAAIAQPLVWVCAFLPYPAVPVWLDRAGTHDRNMDVVGEQIIQLLGTKSDDTEVSQNVLNNLELAEWICIIWLLHILYLWHSWASIMSPKAKFYLLLSYRMQVLIYSTVKGCVL